MTHAGEVAVITGLSRVVLPVSDHGVAKPFWTDQAGFECLQDTTIGDERWVEVRPRDGGPVISLVAGEPARPADPATPSLPTSNVFFECDDLLATHAELSERGVTFSQPPIEQFFGWWAVIEDPDGQRYALRQRDNRPPHG